MDFCPPGSSFHGIFQVRILEWVDISFSRGSSPTRDGNCISYVSCIGRQVLYHYCHLGSSHWTVSLINFTGMEIKSVVFFLAYAQ